MHTLAGGQEQIAETQQTYDLIASEFARQNPVAAAEVADRLDELAASVPAGSVVADIGCGPGRDVMMLRARGLRVAGIDLSLGQLRASDAPGLVQADMRHLTLQAAGDVPTTAGPAGSQTLCICTTRPDVTGLLPPIAGCSARPKIGASWGPCGDHTPCMRPNIRHVEPRNAKQSECF